MNFYFARFIGHLLACYSTKIKNKNQKMKLFITSDGTDLIAFLSLFAILTYSFTLESED